MASGEVVSGLNPDYYLSFKGNENLQVGNIVLSVTTDIARNIYLPKLDSSFARFATGSLHIYIVDVTGSASTNNISIYPHPDDMINSLAFGAPLVINTNRDVVDILSVGYNKWATSSYNGGSGGGGSGSLIQTFSITILAARVIQLLNDKQLFDVAIPAQAEGKLVQMLTANLAVSTYGGTPYDGTNPRLMIGFGGAEAQLTACYFSTSANGAEFTYDYSASPSLPLAWGLAQNTLPAGILTQSDITISSPYDNTVTQGNSDIIICGTYVNIDI